MKKDHGRARFMGNLIRHLFLILISIALLIGQFGCAHVKPKPLTEEKKVQLGRIGIVYAKFHPESKFKTFAKGRLSGAGKGAAIGVGGGAVTGAGVGTLVALGGGMAGGPIGLAVGVLFLPVLAGGGAVIGGGIGGLAGIVTGTSRSVPKRISDEIKTTLKTTPPDSKIQQIMAELILKNGIERTPYRFESVEGEGPASSEEKPTYLSLKDHGIDTVLEVGIQSIGFEGGKGEDPSLSFFMTVRTRIIRTIDGEEIYSRKFDHKTGERNFSDWAANHSTLFREELENSCQNLAKEIVEELFLPVREPEHKNEIGKSAVERI